MKFRMIDRILDWQPAQSIRGVKTVSLEEYFIKSAIDDRPCLPESLLLAAVQELANWFIILASDFTRVGILADAREIRFLQPLRPGESLRINLTARTLDERSFSFDARGRVGPRTVIEADSCRNETLPLPDLLDPDFMRVLFSEIHRPETS